MADIIVQIRGKIQTSKNKCLQLIAKEGEKKLKEYIMQNWYNAYSPGSYNRTMEFYESAKSRVEGNSAIIEEDSGAFSANPSIHGWGQHASLDGTPFTGDAILSVLEKGTNGGISPRNGDAAEALDATESYLKSYIPQAVGIAFGKFRIK